MGYKKRGKATFISIPYAVMDHSNYKLLSPYGVKLLCDLLRQFNGYNNGDLCATYKFMKARGWRSTASLYRTIQELTYYGFIQLTQQGGKHKPSLYALTWKKIDEKLGKPLDVKATREASGLWKIEKEKFNPNPVRKIKMPAPYVNQSTPYMNQFRVIEGIKQV